ncbi:MAG: tail fiber protein [Acidobacteriia bacterium]|nr:tail fiber protein [Terriglobia bacterium]
MQKRNLGRFLVVVVGIAVLGAILGAGEARAQITYVGQIILVPLGYCPLGFAEANGQLLPIAPNAVLFNLLGTTYGGDGVTNFALPDLRGRVPINVGQGSGLTNRNLAESAGEEAHTLTIAELPAHTHAFSLGASTTIATDAQPSAARVLSTSALGDRQFTGVAPNTTLAAGTTGSAGTGSTHNNMQPYLVLRYCVSLFGIFPPPPGP